MFCEECRRAELTPWQRFKEDVATALAGHLPTERFLRIHSGALIAAHLGQTPYDRHRAEYERTGDPAELERMLRHVRK